MLEGENSHRDLSIIPCTLNRAHAVSRFSCAQTRLSYRKLATKFIRSFIIEAQSDSDPEAAMKLSPVAAIFVVILSLVMAAPQGNIPYTLPWFCAQNQSSGGFGNWLRGVVQVWLPPAVCDIGKATSEGTVDSFLENLGIV